MKASTPAPSVNSEALMYVTWDALCEVGWMGYEACGPDFGIKKATFPNILQVSQIEGNRIKAFEIKKEQNYLCLGCGWGQGPIHTKENPVNH